MNYNYLEIISAVEDMVLKTGSEPASDLRTVLKRLVNEAQAIVASDLNSQFSEAPDTLTTVADQETYALPSQYRWGGLHRVYVDGVKYDAVSDDVYEAGDSLNVYKIDPRGEYLYLYPIPEEDGLDITIHYRLNPPDMITGTATAGSTTSITLDTNAPAVDDAINNILIEITSGTGVGQVTPITDYVGATKVASAEFDTAPTTDSVYATIPPFHTSGRIAIKEKTIELYRKRQKLWNDKERSEIDYTKQLLSARRNNLKSRQTPRKMRIQGASYHVTTTEEE